MTTLIEAAVTSRPRDRLLGRDGALHLSDAAARGCLARAHHRAAELELVINVGMYKDHGLAEPALASMIQEDLGANPGHPLRLGGHGTFSFDVVNGGVGVLTAAYLIDGFVGGGLAKLGLIVAADADPAPRLSRDYPFVSAGGAVLLAHGEGDAGFQRFAFETFAEDAGLYDASTRWDPRAGLLGRGRNVLEIYEAPEYASRCGARGTAVARALLAEVDVAPRDIDLLVTSCYPRAFATSVARGLGIPETSLPRVPDALSTAHTAGPIVSLEAAIESGQFARARHALFVTVGAGITVGAAYYRAARPAA